MVNQVDKSTVSRHRGVFGWGVDAKQGNPDSSRHRGVFVNRNLRLATIQAIGFDMDHTLALYHRHEIDALLIRLAASILEKEMGYSSALLPLKASPATMVRGLVVDKLTGNVLKIDEYNYVERAYHGLKRCSRKSKKQTYTNQRIDLADNRFHSVDTFFVLPEVYLYCYLVGKLEDRDRSLDYTNLFNDVRSAVDKAHLDHNMKAAVCRDPGKYVQVDDELFAALASFKRGGKKLFLLTNSSRSYMNVVMNHLISEATVTRAAIATTAATGEESWQDYFDLVVVEAHKPAFFQKKSAMRALVDPTITGENRTRHLEKCTLYTGGSVCSLEEFLGVEGERILYFGDHTFGDILKSKKKCGWRTAMVVPELEEEIAGDTRCGDAVKKLEKLRRTRDEFTDRLNHLKDKRAVKKASFNKIRSELSRTVAEIRVIEKLIDKAYNTYWGSLFHAEDNITRFARQVKSFACIYTSRVSNLLGYPPWHYFRVGRARLPHER